MVMMPINPNASIIDEHRRATGNMSQGTASQVNVGSGDGGATLPPGVGSLSITTPDIVGREFVRQYYTMMADAPHLVCKFYSNESVYVFNGQEPVVGPHLVDQSIESLHISECHTKIRAVDAHETFAKAVLVQVIGEISINSLPHRRFAQTFVLAPKSEQKYYVYNDIFRYLDGLFDENTIVHDTDVLKMQDGNKNMTVNGTLHEDEFNNNQHITTAPPYINANQAQPLPPRSLSGNIPSAVIQNRLVNFEPLPSVVQVSAPGSLPTGAVLSSADSLPTVPPTASDWVGPPSSTAYTTKAATASKVSVADQKQLTTAPKPPEIAAKQIAEPSAALAGSTVTVKEVEDRSTALSEEVQTTVASTDGGAPSSWANMVAGRQSTRQHQLQAVQSSSAAVNTVVPPSTTSDSGQSSIVTSAARDSPAPSSSTMTAHTSAPVSQSVVTDNAGGRPYSGGRGGGMGGGKPFNKELLARQIHIKYLPDDMTEKELHDAFSAAFGAVCIGGVQISRKPQRPNAAYAFVTFEGATSAEKAVQRRMFRMRNDLVSLNIDCRREDIVGRRLPSERSLDRTGGGPSRGGGGGRGRGGLGGGFRGGRGGGPGGNVGGSVNRTFTPRGGSHQYYSSGGGSGAGGAYYATSHDQSHPPNLQQHSASLPQPLQEQKQ